MSAGSGYLKTGWSSRTIKRRSQRNVLPSTRENHLKTLYTKPRRGKLLSPCKIQRLSFLDYIRWSSFMRLRKMHWDLPWRRASILPLPVPDLCWITSPHCYAMVKQRLKAQVNGLVELKAESRGKLLKIWSWIRVPRVPVSERGRKYEDAKTIAMTRSRATAYTCSSFGLLHLEANRREYKTRNMNYCRINSRVTFEGISWFLKGFWMDIKKVIRDIWNKC